VWYCFFLFFSIFRRPLYRVSYSFFLDSGRLYQAPIPPLRRAQGILNFFFLYRQRTAHHRLQDPGRETVCSVHSFTSVSHLCFVSFRSRRSAGSSICYATLCPCQMVKDTATVQTVPTHETLHKVLRQESVSQTSPFPGHWD